jgi:phage FluMu protein Com
MDASGMRKYAVFVLIVGLFSVGLFVVDKDWLTGKMIYNYLFAAIAGIIGFVLDLLIRPKDDKDEGILVSNKQDDTELSEELQEPQPEIKQETPTFGALPNPLEVKVTLPTSMDPTGLSAPLGDAPMIWEIKCPVCDKTLSVKDGVIYNRCPSCGQVFQVRKGKKGIPNS